MSGAGTREKMEETIKRTRTQSFIYFGMQICDAYIGRLFIYLSSYLAMDFTQNTIIIIQAIIEIAGDQLHAVYKKAYIEQLKELSQSYIPAFEKYLAKEVFKEPQNLPQFLSKDDSISIEEKTGVDMTKRQLK